MRDVSLSIYNSRMVPAAWSSAAVSSILLATLNI
jgi:hypothetical protein